MSSHALSNRHAAVLSGCCALLSIYSAVWLTDFSTSYHFGWCLKLGLLCFAGYRFWREPDLRLKKGYGIWGALFMLALGLGMRMDAAGQTGVRGLIGSFCLAVCAGPAAGYTAIYAYRALNRFTKPMALRRGRAFCLSLGLLLLCWLPVLIAFFPGIAGYDMDFQIYQVTSGNYSAHHPLLHTLFLGIFCWLGEALGSLTLGYGLHTLMQVAILAASISYALAWLAGIGCPRWLWIALLAYFALSPQHAVMACSGTKDILFAAAMLAITVELCRLLREPQRRFRRWVLAGDAVLVAIACMLRNNAVYSFVLLIVISFLFFRRKLGKRVLAATLSGVILAQAGMIGLQAATGAASSSVREMLSIPCQQLARVYDRYGLSIPEGYEIIEVLPDAENYFPSRADFTKSSAKVTTSDRLVRFLKLWIREALHHPVEYLDAFLYNTRGFWYVNDLSFATTYDEVEGSPVGCMSLGHHDNIGIAAPWLLPGLRTLWQQLFTLNGYQRFPILWALLHPAFYSWLLGFVLVWAWYRRDRQALFAGFGLACYLLSLLMGPCALIRYQYYLMLAAPVLLGYLCAVRRDCVPEAQQ